MSFFSKKYIKGGNWYTTDTPKGSDLSLDTVITEVASSLAPSSSYLVYTALLSQSGTNAPTVDAILENTLGDIVWSYGGVGYYIGTLNNAFTLNKTAMTISNQTSTFTTLYNEDQPNQIGIIVYNGVENVDSNLTSATIEIRVYP